MSVYRIIIIMGWGVFLFLLVPPVLAVDEPYQMQPIVVIGEKEKPNTGRDEPTAFVTVINRADFPARVKTLSEVLAETVGLEVRALGGEGSFATVSIRGASANQVAVYLDGVPLSGGKGGAVNLADLPLDNVERIEIYRGTAPTRLGEPAIGGAINIISRCAKITSQNELALAYGSFDTAKLDAYRRATQDKWDYLLFFNMFSSQGDFPYQDDNGTPFNPDDDEKRKRQNNDTFIINSVGKIGCQSLLGGRWDLTHDFFRKRQGLCGTGSSSVQAARLNNERHLAQVNYRSQPLCQGHLDFTGRIFLLYEDVGFMDRAGELGVGQWDNSSWDLRYGCSLNSRLSVPDFQTINLLLSGENERYRDIYRPGTPDKNSLSTKIRRVWSIALDDEISLIDKRLTLAPALLYKNIADEFSGQNGYSLIEDPKTHSRDWILGRKFGLGYRITKDISLRGNIGRYYRLPDFTELFGDRGYVVGNPDLKPEKSLNWDLGFKLNHPDYGHFSNLYLEYSFYYMRTENLITYVQNSQNTMIALNISCALTTGHEVEVSGRWGEHWSLSGNFTYQEAKDKGDIVYWRGKTIPGHPRQALFLKAAYHIPQAKFFSEYSLKGKNYLDRYNAKYQPSKENLNLGVTFNILSEKKLTATLEVKNLTDQKHEDMSGYPLPGRAFYVTLRTQF